MSRKQTIIASILLIIFGTSMHFVHHAPFFNHFLGYIFPVTESVMAHMKMVFYPMLLLGIYLVIKNRDIREIGAPVLGSLIVMPLIIAEFFAYWVFVHHELTILDIIIYLVCMIGAVHFAKRWGKSEFVRKWWPLWLILTVAIIFLTGYLTYNAPDWLIFEDMG
jgi:ABC-type iron transport system FetAB permease component